MTKENIICLAAIMINTIMIIIADIEYYIPLMMAWKISDLVILYCILKKMKRYENNKRIKRREKLNMITVSGRN